MKEIRIDCAHQSEAELALVKEQTQLVFRLNHTMPMTDEYDELLHRLFPNMGEGSHVNTPLTVVRPHEVKIGRHVTIMNVCKMFIREVFGDYSPDSIDEETLATIDKFFENNLNVSETSRQLFIHRNTLVYRLDKIQKNTNLDLRNFEDAIAFKIALMVVKYMKHMDTMD